MSVLIVFAHPHLHECAEEIVNLAHMISDESSARLSIPSLVSRADEEALGIKVSGVNKILRKFCNQNDWGYVDHSTADSNILPPPLK